jgi:hypothetical protein
METSARTGAGIADVFQMVARSIEPSESSALLDCNKNATRKPHSVCCAPG